MVGPYIESLSGSLSGEPCFDGALDSHGIVTIKVTLGFVVRGLVSNESSSSWHMYLAIARLSSFVCVLPVDTYLTQNEQKRGVGGHTHVQVEQALVPSKDMARKIPCTLNRSSVAA